ncbi:MAG: DUF4830 domain-containing protein [Eubacterium sp.]|nr:DUF4830 domain-containing protein [Eubacterium sp.]
MQILTIKAKPKTLFGAVLALTGIIVIILTFTVNHPEKAENVNKSISCSTADERRAFLSSYGYEADGSEEKKEITVPSEFNAVYTDYNKIQKQQGFDLEPYKGKSAVIYTYKITNYKNNPNVTANLVVFDGKLIGADLCDPSADSGFLIALINDDKT